MRVLVVYICIFLVSMCILFCGCRSDGGSCDYSSYNQSSEGQKDPTTVEKLMSGINPIGQ